MKALSTSIVGALTAGAVALAAPEAAAQHRCAPVVEAKMAEFGIDKARVTGVAYGLETESGEGAHLVAIRGWISLKDCDGAVVVQMRPDCRFEQAFTWRECKIPGLYHSC